MILAFSICSQVPDLKLPDSLATCAIITSQLMYSIKFSRYHTVSRFDYNESYVAMWRRMAGVSTSDI